MYREHLQLTAVTPAPGVCVVVPGLVPTTVNGTASTAVVNAASVEADEIIQSTRHLNENNGSIYAYLNTQWSSFL